MWVASVIYKVRLNYVTVLALHVNIIVLKMCSLAPECKIYIKIVLNYIYKNVPRDVSKQ